jgi:hypothetical protein
VIPKTHSGAIIVCWVICGIVAAGFANAGFHDDFRWSSRSKCEDVNAGHQSFALVWGALGGPIALVVSMAFTGFGHKGWNLARFECEGYSK